MKRIVILISLLLTGVIVYAQNTLTGYYFHDGMRKEIPVKNQSLLVYFNKTLISLEQINSLYTIEKEVRLNARKADSLYAFVIGIGNNNYDATIANLKSRPYVYDVEPVVGRCV